MIFRCKYSKTDEMAFISHLDLLRIFIRALRRESIDVNYSQGFHPHPKLSFSPALSLGVESVCEMMDIDVASEISPEEFLKKLNKALPIGVKVSEVYPIPKMGGIASLTTHSKYRISLNKVDEALIQRISELLAQEEILIRKKNKKGKFTEINVKDRIDRIEVIDNAIDVILLNSTNGALKPSEFIDILFENHSSSESNYEVYSVVKTQLYLFDGKGMKLVE